MSSNRRGGVGVFIVTLIISLVMTAIEVRKLKNAVADLQHRILILEHR